MDINTQRFLFGSSGSGGDPLWINVTSYERQNAGNIDSFEVCGPLAINEARESIVVSVDAYDGNTIKTDNVTLVWDYEGNFLYDNFVAQPIANSGINSTGCYCYKSYLGTVVNVGATPYSGIPNLYLGEYAFPSYGFANAYIQYGSSLGGGRGVRDLVFGIKSNSTESAAFIATVDSSKVCASYLNYGPSGTSGNKPPDNNWRITSLTGIGSHAAAYNKQITVQNNTDDYFISSFNSNLGQSISRRAYYSYIPAFPLNTNFNYTIEIINAYTAIPINTPLVLEQNNSEYLYFMFSSKQNSPRVGGIYWGKYNLNTDTLINYFGLIGATADGTTNFGMFFGDSGGSGIMDPATDNIATISCIFYDGAVTLANYNILLIRVNVDTAEVIWSKRIAAYNPNTGQDSPVNIVGTKLAYNEFGDLVIAGSYKSASNIQGSAFCMTFNPLTGPPNGVYSNTISAFKIDDYALKQTIGDLFTASRLSETSSAFSISSTSLTTANSPGTVTSQTFNF